MLDVFGPLLVLHWLVYECWDAFKLVFAEMVGVCGGIKCIDFCFVLCCKVQTTASRNFLPKQ
jgi:hypothetical protein